MNHAISIPLRDGRPAKVTLAGLLSSSCAVMLTVAFASLTGVLLGLRAVNAQPVTADGWQLDPPTRNVTAIYAACAGICIRERAQDVIDAAAYDDWLETLREPLRFSDRFCYFPPPQSDAGGVDMELRDFITQQTHERYGLSNEDAEAYADACSRFDEPLKWCARGWAESSAKPNAQGPLVYWWAGRAGHRVRNCGRCTGYFQIHPQHTARMAALGLDFASETDRTTYAKYLYASRGDRPWQESERKRRKHQRELEREWEAIQ